MPRRSEDRLHSERRDRLITIEQRPITDTPDATSGEPLETWTTLVASMPAARIDLTGAERFRADQMTASYDTEWEINYRTDMDPDLVDVPKLRRLLLGTRVHDIVTCFEVGRRAGLRLQTLASSKVPS